MKFPKNSKQLVVEYLKKQDGIWCDAEFCCTYECQRVYCPVAKPGIHWDGCPLIFIDQYGNISETDDLETYHRVIWKINTNQQS